MKIVAKIFMILSVVATLSILNNVGGAKAEIVGNNKFDHLGLEVFRLTPEEEKLSKLAFEISAKKLNELGIASLSAEKGV